MFRRLNGLTVVNRSLAPNRLCLRRFVLIGDSASQALSLRILCMIGTLRFAVPSPTP
jgi:hypothetical protein